MGLTKIPSSIGGDSCTVRSFDQTGLTFSRGVFFRHKSLKVYKVVPVAVLLLAFAVCMHSYVLVNDVENEVDEAVDDVMNDVDEPLHLQKRSSRTLTQQEVLARKLAQRRREQEEQEQRDVTLTMIKQLLLRELQRLVSGLRATGMEQEMGGVKDEARDGGFDSTDSQRLKDQTEDGERGERWQELIEKEEEGEGERRQEPTEKEEEEESWQDPREEKDI